MPRRCRDCSECCTALVVDDVPTDAFERCKHQCARGCSIYAKRPKPCADFECNWLLGLGGNGDRPDKSGVVFTGQAHPSLPEGRWLYKAHIMRETERGWSLINRVANQALVYVVFRNGQRQVLGPPEDVHSFRVWGAASGLPVADGQTS